VVNNILAGNGTTFNSRQMAVETGTNHVVDSNILWSRTVSLQGLYNATGQRVTHSILLDPLFINSASHDYHLLVGSPAISLGNRRYGQPVDRDGVEKSSTQQIGAYRYGP
jgi:hypothetical protein